MSRAPKRLARRLLPKTLFSRMLLIVLVPMVLLLTATVLFFYDRHLDTVTRRLSNGLAGEISYLVELYELRSGDSNGLLDILAAQRTFDIEIAPMPLDAWVKLDKGITSYYTRTLSRELEQRLQRPFHVFIDDETLHVFVRMETRVLEIRANRKKLFTPTSYIFLLWTIGLGSLLFSIAMVFLRNQIRPLRRLARAADAVGRGMPLQPLPVGGASEVRAATEAFNVMGERLFRLVSGRTLMLAAVSHDLRTPLARLKLNLSLLETPQIRSDIEAMQSDINHMDKIIETYLDFAKGVEAESIQRFDLAALLRQLEPHCDAPALLPFLGRPTALRRMLENILSNAARYGNGKTEVQLTQQDGQVFISIGDNGAGIPPEQREHVLRPFTRLESARGTASGGVGLGLAIAQDIAHRHGGALTLSKSRLGGLLVTVHLPKRSLPAESTPT